MASFGGWLGLWFGGKIAVGQHRQPNQAPPDGSAKSQMEALRELVAVGVVGRTQQNDGRADAALDDKEHSAR